MTVEIEDLVLPPPGRRQQKRDSTYWRARLKREAPAIYEQLERREIPSVNEATYRAGLQERPTRLKLMQGKWKGMTSAEKHQFVEWLKAQHGIASKAKGPPAARGTASLTGADGHFTGDAIGRLWDAMITRGKQPADVMEEIGRNRYETTFQEALMRRRKPRPELVDELTKWLSGA